MHCKKEGNLPLSGQLSLKEPLDHSRGKSEKSIVYRKVCLELLNRCSRYSRKTALSWVVLLWDTMVKIVRRYAGPKGDTFSLTV